MRFLNFNQLKPNLYWLMPFIFITLLTDKLLPDYAALNFILSCISIIPLAVLLSDATSEIAQQAGDVTGAFLNATFGNATEFIIAIVALYAGQMELVKATMTGAIIGNILLVLGLSFFAGGLKHRIQYFNKLGAESLSIALIIAIIALIVPASYQQFAGNTYSTHYIQPLSNAIAVTLLVVYFSSLIFSFVTHRDLISKIRNTGVLEKESFGWSMTTAIFFLFLAALLIAIMSEILVRHVEHAATTLGISNAFIGIVIIGIVGNAGEHSASVIMAAKNKLDITMNIAMGSSTQIALFIVPVLVLLSTLLPTDSMNLIFSPGQIILILLSIFTVSHTVSIGESTWYKGIQLLAVYAIMGMALYFVY